MEATSEKKYDLSVLVPFYNEEENLEENYDQIKKALSPLSLTSEIIYINDGSTDSGPDIIKAIAKRDPKVKLVSFMRNFG